MKARHAAAAFDGEGARRYGGRWNHRGTAAVYASDSLALAALELFVHLGRTASALSLVSFAITLPAGVRIERLAASRLPRSWREEPPPEATKEVGTDWLRRGTAVVLRVPSVIVPSEANYLLNPAHVDFAKLVIAGPEPFGFDARMWK